MTFTASDLHALVELVYKHPEWRAELRQLVLTEDILTLPQLMRELVEAQRSLTAAQDRTEARVEDLAAAQDRTEARVEDLAAAQDRTEARVEELAAAQARTDQSLKKLAAAQDRTEARVEELAAAQARTDRSIKKLAAAQARTEDRVDDLADAIQATRSELGNLSNRVGATAEEEAEGTLMAVLEDQGYRVGEPVGLRWNGEVDVVLPAWDSEGQPLWALVEAKVRLSQRAVEAWSNRVRSEGFQAALRAADLPGPYLAYVYGMRADAGARRAAERFGIGLLNSQGEQIPPGERISAPE